MVDNCNIRIIFFFFDAQNPLGYSLSTRIAPPPLGTPLSYVIEPIRRVGTIESWKDIAEVLKGVTHRYGYGEGEYRYILPSNQRPYLFLAKLARNMGFLSCQEIAMWLNGPHRTHQDVLYKGTRLNTQYNEIGTLGGYILKTYVGFYGEEKGIFIISDQYSYRHHLRVDMLRLWLSNKNIKLWMTTMDQKILNNLFERGWVFENEHKKEEYGCCDIGENHIIILFIPYGEHSL